MRRSRMRPGFRGIAQGPYKQQDRDDLAERFRGIRRKQWKHMRFECRGDTQFAFRLYQALDALHDENVIIRRWHATNASCVLVWTPPSVEPLIRSVYAKCEAERVAEVLGA